MRRSRSTRRKASPPPGATRRTLLSELALPHAAGTGVLVAAGLLVGVGTRLANGCTSGHGVCGLARLSLRSLANVLVFMGAGFATVYVARHLLGG